MSRHTHRLTRLAESLNSGYLRTTHMDGVPYLGKVPQLGYSFNMLGDSLTPENDSRLISTSLVETVEALGDHTYRFITVSGSTYLLEPLTGL